jgi:hypothetical protein
VQIFHWRRLRARDGVPKPAILALRWVQPHRQVAVRQIDEHSIIVALDAIRHRLQRVHLEGHLALKIVECAIVGAETELPVLLGDHENRGLEVLEWAPRRAARRMACDSAHSLLYRRRSAGEDKTGICFSAGHGPYGRGHRFQASAVSDSALSRSCSSANSTAPQTCMRRSISTTAACMGPAARRIGRERRI